MNTKGLNGAEALLHVLRGMGVETIFASPGSEWAPVWEALAKNGGSGEYPEYISFRHEETVIAAATAYYKATGKLPGVIIHTTVGALHATMALRAALHERVPMVVFTGESIGFGEDDSPDPGAQWLRLLTDMGGPAPLVERCVKWTFGLNVPALLPATIHRACQLAMAAPAGPVFVSLPMEVQFATMTHDAPPGVYVQPSTPDPAAMDAIADRLTAAKRPVIVTEGVGRSVQAVASLVALAEQLGAPVLEGRNPSFMNFPHTHPLYGGLCDTAQMKTYLNDADLVFLADAVIPWHPPSALPGPNTSMVMLGDAPLYPQVPYLGLRADLVVQANVAQSLSMINERVNKKIAAGARAGMVKEWGAKHEQARAAWRDRAQGAAKSGVIDTAWVANELNAVLPGNAIVVDETITHRYDLYRGLEAMKPGSYFEAAYGGLGMGLGYALGVKYAARNRPVITTIGDGSFNYNPVVASFGACQEHGLPALILVMNNSGYLSQKGGIPKYYPDGAAVRTKNFPGTTITPSPNYAALPLAFEGVGERVVKPSDLRPALLRGLEAIGAGKLALIDIVLAEVNPRK